MFTLHYIALIFLHRVRCEEMLPDLPYVYKKA
jgi:hypothetical protein